MINNILKFINVTILWFWILSLLFSLWRKSTFQCQYIVKFILPFLKKKGKIWFMLFFHRITKIIRSDKMTKIFLLSCSIRRVHVFEKLCHESSFAAKIPIALVSTRCYFFLTDHVFFSTIMSWAFSPLIRGEMQAFRVTRRVEALNGRMKRNCLYVCISIFEIGCQQHL